MDLSIIIVAHNVKNLVEECLVSIDQSNDRLAKEVLFVDNGSSDGTVDMVKKRFPHVVVFESKENLGFIRANNLAYEKATGKYILMLNSDAFLGKDTLQTIIDFMEKHPESGVVGIRQTDRDGTVKPSARYFPTPWRIFLMKTGFADKVPQPFWKNINDMRQSHDHVKECDWVCGCCLFTRKDIVDSFGYFLRDDFFMYNDDNDLCLRIKRRGWKIHFFPESVVHLGGVNNRRIDKLTGNLKRSEQLQIESDYIYFRKNYNLLHTLFHFFYLALFDILQILKRIFLFNKKISIRDQLDHLAFSYRILRDTKFGQSAIH